MCAGVGVCVYHFLPLLLPYIRYIVPEVPWYELLLWAFNFLAMSAPLQMLVGYGVGHRRLSTVGWLAIWSKILVQQNQIIAKESFERN